MAIALDLVGKPLILVLSALSYEIAIALDF